MNQWSSYNNDTDRYFNFIYKHILQYMILFNSIIKTKVYELVYFTNLDSFCYSRKLQA